jgi:ComF family protein
VTTLAPLAGLRFAGLFEGPLQQAVHQLKYRNDFMLADTLAVRLPLAGPDPAAPGTLVVPVPLAAERLRERGYNQAELLARTFAELHGLRLAPSAARRVRHTASQVWLSPPERRANVAGAFAADPLIVQGLPIILVDDVCTTGATLAACAESLVSAGATTVWGLTLARALTREVRLQHSGGGRRQPA